MIVGVGLDLVEIAHFRRIIQKGGVAFYKKILTPIEFKEVRALSQPHKSVMELKDTL